MAMQWICNPQNLVRFRVGAPNNRGLAQLAEHRNLTPRVAGSSPASPAIQSSLNSVRRVSPLQGGGRRFESYSEHQI